MYLDEAVRFSFFAKDFYGETNALQQNLNKDFLPVPIMLFARAMVSGQYYGTLGSENRSFNLVQPNYTVSWKPEDYGEILEDIATWSTERNAGRNIRRIIQIK